MSEWNGHFGPPVVAKNGFEILDCEPCGSKHAVPIPSREQLEALYRQDYYAVEKPLYLERAREDLDWWDVVYADRYDSFERLLGPRRRRILDVGTGPGFFLLHGQRRGWRALGGEPSRQAAAHCRGLGLQVIEQPLTDALAPSSGPSTSCTSPRSWSTSPTPLAC